MATARGLTRDGLISLSDVELLVETYDYVGSNVLDGVAADGVYWFLQDIVVRLAPEVAEQAEPAFNTLRFPGELEEYRALVDLHASYLDSLTRKRVATRTK
jgi:hypothetical protein